MDFVFTARRTVALVVGFACAIAIHAQESRLPPEVRVSAKPYAPGSLTLRAESDLVEVGTVVRGHNGHAIPGLGQKDFQLLDQGAPREITYFAVESGAGVAASPLTGTRAPAITPQSPSMAARPPRFIALFFDDLNTNGVDLQHAQTAARRFVNEGLDAGDRVAMFASSGNVLDFTTGKPALMAAIDKLKPHPRLSEAGQTVCPRITPYQAYLIAVLLDPAALHAATDEAKVCSNRPDDVTSAYTQSRKPGEDPWVQMIKGQAEQTWAQARVVSQATLDAIGGAVSALANMQGRRLLLLASSGFISGTLERQRDRLINQALHAGIVINALDAKGLYTEAPVRPLSEPLEEMALPTSTYQFEVGSLGSRLATATDAMAYFAQSTGGLFFRNNNDLAFGFRQLGSIPDVSYVLGFHPDEIAADGSYRRLKVRLIGSNPYVIQARPGYFALPKETPDSTHRRQKLDHEVMGDSTLQELPATLTYQPAGHAKGMVTLRVQIHVDIGKLPFPKNGDRRVEQLELVAALLDAKGNLVAAKEGTMDFALTDATYARLSGTGINGVLNLEAPPGVYRLRGVVQESVEGRMASSAQTIEVK